MGIKKASDLHKIRVASWLDDHDGPMTVVSGSIGRKEVHYEALPAERLENGMHRLFFKCSRFFPRVERDGRFEFAKGGV